MKKYPLARFDELLNSSFNKIMQLNKLKGGEYAGDVDKLANFRRNAEAVGVSMETCWRIYAGKHWDAISQYVHDITTGRVRERLEGIEGRVDDLVLYLLIFKAMVEERSQEKAPITPLQRMKAVLDNKVALEQEKASKKFCTCGVLDPTGECDGGCNQPR